MQTSQLTAPELFGRAAGGSRGGAETCHWCGGPCGKEWRHDDPGPSWTAKNPLKARMINSPYCCGGCRAFRAGRTTVHFLTPVGKHFFFLDGQSPQNYSWWITGNGAWAVRDRESEKQLLLEHLLNPPLLFCLSLCTKTPNPIHLGAVNSLSQIDATTPLAYTIDGTTFHYTVYELQEAMKGAESGLEPGSRELMRWLGDPPPPKDMKRGRGRPRLDPTLPTEKLIRASGQVSLSA